MKAARIHRFGPPDAILIDDVPVPAPSAGEVLMRVACSGVGPWDALIRERKSAVDSPLPITLGSDLSGVIESVGSGVHRFSRGDDVYGVTNPRFIDANAEYAIASAGMIAKKPASLNFEEAASAPVVAVTAWQMLFDYGQARAGQRVFISGAAGNVGAYAVRLASLAGLEIYATASEKDISFVENLGAAKGIDYATGRFEEAVPPVDIVLDLVGGETQKQSFAILKPGGILVSAVSQPSPPPDSSRDLRALFFLVEVTTERLDKLTPLYDRGELRARLGTVLPLDQIRKAHEMLAGAPHPTGKIVLKMSTV